MRKTLTALLFAATLPAVALAMPDEGRHQGGIRGEPHGMMFKELDLSREQRESIGKLMREQMKSRHDITQRYLDKLPEAEQKAMQQELEAARKQQHDSIRALLKPEQQKDFDELVKKMEERRAERAEFEAWKAEKDKAE